MNKIQLFKNEQFGEIRTVVINDDIWFVAKDICDMLDLGNVSMSLERLSDKQKLTSTLLISGQNRSVNVISESGLYKLAFTSRKPEAEARFFRAFFLFLLLTFIYYYIIFIA
jgi:prophage antirepressor-like protein